MARASKEVAVAAPQSRALSTIDAELANEAALIKQQVGQSSGNKIKVEATGDFILPDGSNMGNQIEIVVVDFVSRNTFYIDPYNAQNPSPPDCYAIGKVIQDMAPEDDSPQKQNADCRTCPLNAFGSGANGKSKACKNSRVLAVLVVDPNNPDAHNEMDAPVYSLELPPTAIQSFDNVVTHVGRALNGAPIKAIVTANAKNVGTYAKITFADPVPNPDYAIHFARRAEVTDMLFRKPDYAAYAARQPQARGRKPAPSRAPARR